MTDIKKMQEELEKIKQELAVLRKGSLAYKTLVEQKTDLESRLLGSGVVVQGENSTVVGQDADAVSFGGDLSGSLVKGNENLIIQNSTVVVAGNEARIVVGEHIEQTNLATSPLNIQVPLLVKKAIIPIGRKEDIKNIIRILRDTASSTQVLILYGLRGVGKSTLAEMVCDTLNRNFQSISRYYLHQNFNLAELYYWLFKKIPPKELIEQGYRQFSRAIALEVATKNLLLVLDGCEILIDPTTNLVESTQLGFSELLDALMTIHLGSSRIIVTGWQKFITLSGQSIPGYHVDGLNVKEAIQLLRKYGVNASHDALILAAQRTRGHPQALIWLAALLSYPSMYTIDMACSEEGIWHPEHGEVATRILDKVFLDILSELEKSVLSDLWVFDEPVSVDAVCYVDDGKQNNMEIYRAVNLLAQKAMLTILDDKRILLDDLVRDYVAHQIVNKQKRHSDAGDWYLCLPRQPADEWKYREDALVTLQAINHLTLGHRQNDAMNIIKDKRGIGAKLSYFGMHVERIRMAESLLNPSISGTWSLTLYDKGWLMRLAGFSYAALGDYDQGKMLLENARTIFLSSEILAEHFGADNLAVCLNALGKVALWQGNHSQAIEYHEQALDVCQKYRLYLPEVITCADIAEANVYGFYETRSELLLSEALTWGDKVLSSPIQNKDSIIRAQACRSEALAWLGNNKEAIKSALDVLELNMDTENLYSYVQALRAIAISESRVGPSDLFLISLARAQQLSIEFQYSYGQARIREIIQSIEAPNRIASLVQEKADQMRGKVLDELVIQHIKCLDL